MSLLDFFNKPQKPVPPAMTENISGMYVAPKIKTVDPTLIPSAIRQLESSGGTDPNTPRNQVRTYTIPAANGNEKSRVIKYNSGYAGEYGITPIALANLAKSQINNNAATSTYTKYGKPLIPGKSPEEIQKMMLTPEGAGQLSHEIFISQRKNKDDHTPEGLTADYMDTYVGKGTKNYTPKNRARVLQFFTNLAK